MRDKTKDKGEELPFSWFVQNIALAASIATASLFVSGHFIASKYYESLGIDYFQFAESSTAFKFALENYPRIVFAAYIILMMTVAVFIVAKINNLFRLTSKSFKVTCFILAFLFVAQTLATYFLVSPKLTLINRMYTPLDVKADNTSLSCVSSIGLLGDYRVFANAYGDTYLIQSSQIQSIQPKFYPLPTSSAKDPEADYVKWLKYWKENCPGPSKEFKHFEYEPKAKPEKSLFMEKKPRPYKFWLTDEIRKKTGLFEAD